MHKIFQVEYDALQQIATGFQTQSETTNAILDKMITTMQRLEQGGWIGRGSHAFFREMHTEIIPAFTRLSQALAEGSHATTTIIGIVHAAEEEASLPFRTGNTALPNVAGGTPGSSVTGGGTPGSSVTGGGTSGSSVTGGGKAAKMIDKKVSAKLSYFDKKSLLPRYTHVDGVGKNGKFAPVAPGIYSRYGGREVARSFNTNGSADPRKWTRTDDTKPKDANSKFGVNFAIAGNNTQLLGDKTSDPNAALQGRYGVWENHSAGFRVDGDGLKAQAAAEIRAGVEGSAKKVFFDGQPVKVEAKGTVFAGGYANIGSEATFTKERAAVSAQASAFAGVEVKGSAKAIGTVNGHEVGNVEATVGATSGIGAQAEATASYQNGKVRLVAGGKFALGLGLSFKLDSTIDVKQSYQAAKESVTSVVNYAERNSEKITFYMLSLVR